MNDPEAAGSSAAVTLYVNCIAHSYCSIHSDDDDIVLVVVVVALVVVVAVIVNPVAIHFVATIGASAFSIVIIYALFHAVSYIVLCPERQYNMYCLLF